MSPPVVFGGTGAAKDMTPGRRWLPSPMPRRCVFAWLFGTLLFQALAGWAQTVPSLDAVDHAVLYTDTSGVTYFGDESLPLRSRNGAATRGTEPKDATDFGFVRLPSGPMLDWHPAPRKQFVMVLEGIMEVEAGDGETRRFQAGDVLLVTDTDGKGHRTGVVGEDDVLLVWVRVP